MTDKLEPLYEELENGSIDDHTDNCCCKWFSRFYFIGTPLIALLFLILASLNVWSNDNLNACVSIVSCIYITCHWGCYVVKCNYF